jgi:diaminohydroxyphosphoribosylaminopyrimidine deaminase/5-amino-6-(5-phosphoribosylamino)uracil reductase
LYVTLEPCSTQGRTPPCTDAIIAAGIRRVVVGAIDPNPRHRGRGLRILQKAGLSVTRGVLEPEATELNEAFNHWIVHQTPFVTVKSAMTFDGKIATATGESRWITCPESRALAMRLRLGADAILVGINTVLADDPQLTLRPSVCPNDKGFATRLITVASSPGKAARPKLLRRVILDSRARTPLHAKVIADAFRSATVVVVGPLAPPARVARLEKRVTVWRAPLRDRRIDLGWLLERLGAEQVLHLLVEGGGTVNASFLLGNLAQRLVFFYAPKILGGKTARKAVAGTGATSLDDAVRLCQVGWRRLGSDLVLTAKPC